MMPAGVAIARDLSARRCAAVTGWTPDVRRGGRLPPRLTDADGHRGRVGRQGAAPGRSRCCRPRRPGASPRARRRPRPVAVELVHNFSLLHDDIMDGDTERRHRPTVWTVYGVGAGASWPATRCWRWPQDCCSRRLGAAAAWAARCSVRGRAAADRAGRARTWPSSAATTSRSSECLDDGRRQDRRADGRARCSIGARLAGAPPARGHGPGRVRRARRAGLPADRRPARHLGRPGGHRQAGARPTCGPARSRCRSSPR